MWSSKRRRRAPSSRTWRASRRWASCTSSLAHELNQPLTAIVANAQAARRLLAHSSAATDELRLVLGDIVDDGRRAGAVIQRTREMLHKGGISPTRLDLGALVRDVAGLVTNDALNRNVTLQLSLSHTPAFVEGDRIQLQQVILNLLINALEAIGDDPSNARLIHVRADLTDGATVEVLVRDTGPGMPAPAARVFDAFYTTKPSGMGMGLPIARSIVEAHGGFDSCGEQSRRGRHCRLPAAAGDRGRGVIAGAPTVFIVDDDPSVRRSLARLLTTFGFATETFGSAREFLGREPLDAPSCLLLDVRMPELSGFDLFERLKAAGRDLPVIFITGHGDIPMAVRAIKAGAVDFLVKPFDEEALMNAVEQAIAQARTSSGLRGRG